MSDSFVSPWTVASQAPLSIGLPRQEYWSGLTFPSWVYSQPRDWIRVSCIGRQILYRWVSREGEGEGEVTQSCPTLCDPMDCILPGSSVHGIFQARVLEWIAISFSRASSWPRNQIRVSRIAGRRFTVWATREASGKPYYILIISHLLFPNYTLLMGNSLNSTGFFFHFHLNPKLHLCPQFECKSSFRCTRFRFTGIKILFATSITAGENLR